jgi:hypothetical protein
MHTRGARRLSALIGGLAVTIGLVGCTGITSERADGLLLVRSQGEQPGDEARILGSIAVTEGRCVGLRDDEGVVRLVIWPQGTELVRSSPLLLQVARSEELSEGDAVTGAGGYYDDPEDLAQQLEQCAPDDLQVIRIRFDE